MPDQLEFLMRPIGVIHTPVMDKAQTPIQSSRSQAIGQVEVDLEFAAGRQDREGLSHLILLYVFHQSMGYALQVKPFLDDQLHGLFATRYPRPPQSDWPLGRAPAGPARQPTGD
jgi:tRNA (Thr-GGU) A37 N-methylase